MKKLLTFLTILFLTLCTYSQIPIEFGIHARGSDINGILGAELQIGSISISESWRPMTKGVNSAITALSVYFINREVFNSIPYVTFGYSTKGYPYTPCLETYLYGYYDLAEIGFYPAVFTMFGVKTIIPEISERFSGKAGIGLTISEYGHYFSFELSINYVLFKNKTI